MGLTLPYAVSTWARSSPSSNRMVDLMIDLDWLDPVDEGW